MKLRLINLLAKRKLLFTLLPILLLVATFLFWPHTTYAIVGDIVIEIVGNVASAWIWVLGKLVVQIIRLVIWVAGYNDFINSDAVSNGWTILRDLCNMFFILILLVIAFATTLNRESYAMKALLPKFILAAILINFSKLICGVIIDFAQVIMLTFVNGFRDIGGGNFADMLGITGLMDISEDCGEGVSTMSVVGSFILAVLYLVIAGVVITVILFILVMRVIMIWIYVVLSPLAWLLSVLPATQKYASQWWKQFAETVASGPILAFFIWLSFVSVAVSPDGKSILGEEKSNYTDNEKKFGESFKDKATCVGLSTAGTPDGMLKFVISIGMLMAGLIITKQLGGAIGGIAGGGLSKIQNAAKGAANRLHRPVTDRVKAFQNKREGARKERIEAFGNKAYGSYLDKKDRVKATVKSTLAGGGAVLQQGINKMAGSKSEAVRNVAGILNGPKDIINAYRQYKAKKTARKVEESLEKERRHAAYADPGQIYKDVNGKEYEYHKQTDTYRHYNRDERGVPIVGPDGKAYDVAKKADGGNVQKMSDMEFASYGAWNEAMKKSKAYNNPEQEKRTENAKKEMLDAGFSNTQLLLTLKNNSLSSERRMAAALALAVKQGFKSRSDVKEASDIFAGTHNKGLQKQFNDEVDKKQAYLNYDLTTEAGKNQFIKRHEDGKFDVMEHQAYKGEDGANVLKVLKESMTDKEFASHIAKINNTSAKHSASIESGYETRFTREKVDAVDENGSLTPERLAAVLATGKLNFAWAGRDEGEKKSIMTAAIRAMNNREIGDLKKESFNYQNSDGTINEDLKQTIMQAFHDAGRNLRDIKSITEGNGNAGLIAAFKEIFKPVLQRYSDAIEEKKAGGTNAKIIK